MSGATPRYSPEAILRRRQRNHAKWIAAAKGIHGPNRSDYDPSARRYRHQKGPPVKLICKTHATAFHVLPRDHLRYKGGGCPKCEFLARSVGTLDDQRAKFMAWFEENGARLALETPFAGMTKEIGIRCLVHGTVETTKPTYLMVSGTFGCALCARESQAASARLEKQALRDELEPTFPSHIRYLDSYFDELSRCTKIRIHCANHGEKEMRAAGLRKSSYKCPDCGN